MSSSKPIGTGGSDVQGLPQGAELEITYAVKTKDGWKPTGKIYDSHTQGVFRKALGEIQEQAQQRGKPIQLELGKEVVFKEGSVKEKSFVQDGQEKRVHKVKPFSGWTLGAFQARRKAGHVVTDALNQLETVTTKGQKVKVTIKVVYKLEKSLNEISHQEEQFQRRISTVIENLTRDKETLARDSHFNATAVDHLITQYGVIKDKSMAFSSAIETAKYKIVQGIDVQIVMDELSDYFNSNYLEYSQALTDAVVSQEKFKDLGLSEKYGFGIGYGELHLGAFKEIVESAKSYLETSGVEAHPGKWEEALNSVEAATQQFHDFLRGPEFIQHFDFAFSQTRYATESLEIAKPIYSGKTQQAFYAHCKKAGFNESTVNYVFGVLKEVSEVQSAMMKGMEEVRALRRERRYDEAMQRYNRLMMDEFPKYIETMKKAEGPLRILGDPQGGNALAAVADEFLQKIYSKQFPRLEVPSMLGLFQTINDLPMRVFSDFSEVMESYPGLTEKNETLKSMENTLMGAQVKQRETLNKHRVLLPNQHVLVKSFRNSALASDPRWQRVLEHHHVTEEDIRILSEINEAYGRLAAPLILARDAIDRETNLERQQSARQLLKVEAEKRIPEFKRLSDKYKAIGGNVKNMAIAHALAEYRGILQKEYAEVEAGLKAGIGPASFQGTLEELVREPSYAIAYGAAFDFHSQYQKIQSALSNFETSLDFLNQKKNFVNLTFEEVGLRTKWQEKHIENVLLQGGRFVKDRAWKDALIEQGWKEENIKTDLKFLSDFMDDFANAAEPLQLAHKALNQDPGNPGLQRAYRKVADEVFPKLNHLSKKFKSWGGIEKVEQLDRAVESYKNDLNDRLESVNDIKKQAELRQDIKDLELLPSFSMLFTFLDKDIQAMKSELSQKMHSEPGFVTNIFNRFKVGFFAETWEKNLKAGWDKALSDNFKDPKQAEAFAAAFEEWGQALTPLYELKRAHQADPLDNSKKKKLDEAIENATKMNHPLQIAWTKMRTMANSVEDGINQLGIFLESYLNDTLLLRMAELEETLKLNKFDEVQSRVQPRIDALNALPERSKNQQTDLNSHKEELSRAESSVKQAIKENPKAHEEYLECLKREKQIRRFIEQTPQTVTLRTQFMRELGFNWK